MKAKQPSFAFMLTMSKRLYYEDAYTMEFTAVITERIAQNGRTAIILNQSYFYPESGGQPADFGRIDGWPVVDVTIRKEDGAVLHWLGKKAETEIETETETEIGGEATAVIDWARRFDHMQHHTGQHILSQAFIRIADAHTVGFHLSGESVTIDLDNLNLTPEQINQAEQLANQIIWENRPIHIQTATLEQARQMPLRKLPPVKNGQLRLIDIEDFDLTACGGTHVARTGSVGLVKIIKLERRKEKLRVEFRCGGRALVDYGRKNESVAQLVTALTTSQDELATAVAGLQTENKEMRRALRKMKAAIQSVEADKLLETSSKIGDIVIIARAFHENEGVDLRAISHHLTQKAGIIVLLGMAGSKSQLLFSRSKDAPGEMNTLLKITLEHLGKGGGGGTAVSAQGGGPAIEMTRLQQAINQTKQHLFAQLKK